MKQIIIGSDTFCVFNNEKPKPKPSLSITEFENVSLNRALQECMPKRFNLAATSDGLKIAILKDDDAKAFAATSSGAIKAVMFVNAIKASGITLPARYEFERDDVHEYWIGTLVPTATTPKPDKATKKPRRSNLSSMLPKTGGGGRA